MFSVIAKGISDGSHSDYCFGQAAHTSTGRHSAPRSGGSSSGLFDRDRDSDFSVATVDADHQGDIEGNYWEAVDSGLFGDLPDFSALAGEEDEVDCPSPLRPGEESAFFLSQHSSHIKETKEVASLLEDLSPEQAVIFRFLSTHIRSLFQTKGSAARKAEIMEWMFSADAMLEHAVFDDCCLALECRPWVVRLRIHLELWRKDIQLSERIRGLIVPVPERILEESYALAGSPASWLLHRVWEFPGIPHERLCRDRDDEKALELLDEAGILIASYRRFWYCVGRSPLNRNGMPRSQSWASFWRKF